MCTRYRDPTSVSLFHLYCHNCRNAVVLENFHVSKFTVDFHFLFQCFFPQNLIDNVKTPLFILNAAYDSWQVMQPLSWVFLVLRADFSEWWEWEINYLAFSFFFIQVQASLASPTGVWKLPTGVVNEVQYVSIYLIDSRTVGLSTSIDTFLCALTGWGYFGSCY